MKHQPTLSCRDEGRRQTVRHQHRNGIDYVEVDCVEIDNWKRTELRVHLFRDAPQSLDEIQALLEGGRRVRDIRVTRLWVEEDDKDCLRLTVDKAGDFSPYTLRLVAAKDGRPTGAAPPGFDPRYANVQFSFKAACPSDLDCKTEAACPPEKRDEPEINYLAKDYSSFRQLILDRLALIMPDWQERHVPDIGLALVEILAYVGDHLSYYQDAVATEAYLDTARRRISVRRHARLVDYLMHEGCNARAWVCVELTDSEQQELTAEKIWFVAGLGNDRSIARGQITQEEFAKLPLNQCVVFQPLGPAPTIRLFKAHNELKFYTWGDTLCCLPRGATQATLKYEWKSSGTPNDKPKEKVPHPNNQCDQPDQRTPEPRHPPKLSLKAGDVLIFEEVIGPKTGNPADADPEHRWAVRLTKVEPGVDPLNQQHIVEIEWATGDALPFPFCISARLPAPDCAVIEDISVARGNVILVDHGRPADEDPIGQVPREKQVGECACVGSPVEMIDVPGEFDPELKEGPLTFSQPLTANPLAPASMLSRQNPREALPNITIQCLPGLCRDSDTLSEPELRDNDNVNRNDPQWQWLPQRDLLGSNGSDQHFVVEVDNEGRSHLRFGDGELGRQPEACAIISGRYRVGNGPAGNVGAETITTIVLPELRSGVNFRPRNPLPAHGGTAPESMAEVKLFAPGAFRKVLQRAIIADDYARLAEREFKDEVQRAGASLRWTGSWYEAQVAVDPRGTEEAGTSLLRRIEWRLHRYCRMGRDLKAVTARLVPLDIALTVCVLPHYLRGHVEAAMLEVFGTSALPDGRLGFFHPDNLTFGDGIYLGKLVAAAQAVTGVESVRVTKLERLYEGPNHEIENGLLPFSQLEVAQLDNDPSFPEHGRLTLTMGGGR